jgi:hypothetical protein
MKRLKTGKRSVPKPKPEKKVNTEAAKETTQMSKKKNIPSIKQKTTSYVPLSHCPNEGAQNCSNTKGKQHSFVNESSDQNKFQCIVQNVNNGCR